jgi:uncharacterized surface protein with fasciclin (FAS1) repeats
MTDPKDTKRTRVRLGTTAARLRGRVVAALPLAALLVFGGSPAGAAYAQAQPDLVDTAAAAGQFTTLAAALQAAGLVETLKGPGPFTVFAPTDAAFAALPPGTVEGLLADPAALTAVLTYHVVPGRVLAADVAGLTEAPTVQGRSLAIDASDGVRVDGAAVVTPDLLAENGVIHVIDRVLLPE